VGALAFGGCQKEAAPKEKIPKELSAQEKEKAVFAALDKGALALRAGKADLAQAHFEDAQKLAPDDGRVFFWLGQASAEKGQDDAARNLLEKALSKDPGNYEWVQSFDALLVRMKILPPIILAWDQFLKIHPEKAEAYLARANAHKRAGDAEANKKDLEKACELKLQKACQFLRIVR
jgi:Tfp pilus assembly protein PilF